MWNNSKLKTDRPGNTRQTCEGKKFLERLFSNIVSGRRNLPLRGDQEHLENSANGNFLGQV